MNVGTNRHFGGLDAARRWLADHPIGKWTPYVQLQADGEVRATISRLLDKGELAYANGKLTVTPKGHNAVKDHAL